MVEIAHQRVVANGIKQHYVEAGSGPPVVLLHGFPETWYAWRHQIPALEQRYRLIVPDLRGYGATEKPAAGYDERTTANEWSTQRCSAFWRAGPADRRVHSSPVVLPAR